MEKWEWAVPHNPGALSEAVLMWVFSAFPGLQQTPGHPHGALRHSQSQLDEVASPSRVRSGIKEKWKAKLGLCLVPLVFSRNILLHIPLHLLLRQVLSKAVCPLSGTGLK